jgi:hypothetical protein
MLFQGKETKATNSVNLHQLLESILEEMSIL